MVKHASQKRRSHVRQMWRSASDVQCGGRVSSGGRSWEQVTMRPRSIEPEHEQRFGSDTNSISCCRADMPGATGAATSPSKAALLSFIAAAALGLASMMRSMYIVVVEVDVLHVGQRIEKLV